MSGPRTHQVLVSPLIGGAGIVAIRLAIAAKKRGLPSVAWVPGPGPASRALDADEVSWHEYDLDSTRGPLSRQLWACARMLPALAATSRPIVHVHNPTVYRFVLPALAIVRARTVVHFQIEPTVEEVRWAMRDPPNHIVTCAKYIASKVRGAMGASAERVAISAVPNAVDVNRFVPGSRDEARARTQLTTNRVVLLMMANLAPHKGQETALRALKELTTRHIDAECWLAGEDRASGGAYERELRALVNTADLADRVKFLGFRSDGHDLLKAADVLLLPSTHEGLPLTVLEAQASKVPVVASTIPGVMEVIEHGRTGMTIPADDHVGYANAIEGLYRNPELRHTIVEAASRQAHAEYSWEALEGRMFDIYASLNPAVGVAPR